MSDAGNRAAQAAQELAVIARLMAEKSKGDGFVPEDVLQMHTDWAADTIARLQFLLLMARGYPARLGFSQDGTPTYSRGGDTSEPDQAVAGSASSGDLLRSIAAMVTLKPTPTDTR